MTTRLRTTFAATCALLTVLGGAARAGDFCLSWKHLGFIPDGTVGKAFRIPPPGRCKPFMGVYWDTGAVSGSACTASDGSHTRFSLTRTYPHADAANSYVVFLDGDLPLPAGGTPGTIRIHILPFSGGTLGVFQEQALTGGPCSTPQPIP